MNMKPTNELSERERRILRDLERDLASRHIDPVKRLVLAAVLVAMGALVALATFPVSVVAATAGFMIRGSRLPPPPGLPTVRAFQRDQGLPALEWLKRRTGWT